MGGGIFDKVKMPDGKGVDAGIGEKVWIVSRDKPRYDEIFSSLEQHNNKITGRVDKDGMLDNEGFALAMHLIKIKCDGHNLPDVLPAHLLPPGHRQEGQIN